MPSIRRLLPVAAMAFAVTTPISLHAADLVRGSYASPRTAVQTTTYTAGRTQECDLLRVTEWDHSKIVRVCYPPFDLNPRGAVTPGSSGGTATARTTVTSYAVQ